MRSVTATAGFNSHFLLALLGRLDKLANLIPFPLLPSLPFLPCPCCPSSCNSGAGKTGQDGARQGQRNKKGQDGARRARRGKTGKASKTGQGGQDGARRARRGKAGKTGQGGQDGARRARRGKAGKTGQEGGTLNLKPYASALKPSDSSIGLGFRGLDFFARLVAETWLQKDFFATRLAKVLGLGQLISVGGRVEGFLCVELSFYVLCGLPPYKGQNPPHHDFLSRKPTATKNRPQDVGQRNRSF